MILVLSFDICSRTERDQREVSAKRNMYRFEIFSLSFYTILKMYFVFAPAKKEKCREEKLDVNF